MIYRARIDEIKCIPEINLSLSHYCHCSLNPCGQSGQALADDMAYHTVSNNFHVFNTNNLELRLTPMFGPFSLHLTRWFIIFICKALYTSCNVNCFWYLSRQAVILSHLSLASPADETRLASRELIESLEWYLYGNVCKKISLFLCRSSRREWAKSKSFTTTSFIDEHYH